MKLFGIVIFEDRKIQGDLVVASIVLTRSVLRIWLLVLHIFRLNMFLGETGLESHVCAGCGGALDTTFLMVDAWTEGKKLMIPVACENVLELVSSTCRWLTANCGNIFFFSSIAVDTTILAVALIVVWFTTKSIARVTGLGEVIQ